MKKSLIVLAIYAGLAGAADPQYIREGSSRYGEIKYNVTKEPSGDRTYIREGSSRYGNIKYNTDSDGYIREGSSRYGKIIGNTKK